MIDWLMEEAGIDVKAAMERLGGPMDPNRLPSPARPAKAQRGPLGEPVKTYDYTDELGKLLFQVCRYEPKDFRQRALEGNGWKFSLDGIRRVLYNLPQIAEADMVWLCEGEKDADTISSFGLVGTTNAMGAEKWDAEYTKALRGKEVVLLPDNDDKGGKHRDLILKHISVAAKSVRVVEMPEGIKDVTEYVESFATKGDGMRSLMMMTEKAEVLYRGISLPIQTLSEMEDDYEDYVRRASSLQYDMSRWIPSLRGSVRPLVPGEVVTFLAGTGVGKTMILQNIALTSQIETLLFEVELPKELSFERFAAMTTNSSGAHVFSMYQTGAKLDWKKARSSHISCVHQSKLTTARIETIIENAALKTVKRPALVLIDYVQLIGATGDSRYEKTSGVMEELKSVAKSTGTIIILASQIGRKDKKNTDPSVGLNDGKDSGSIENSSGVVIGAWRDADDANRLWLRILKNTKGRSGTTVACRISESLLVHEEAKQPEPT